MGGVRFCSALLLAVLFVVPTSAADAVRTEVVSESGGSIVLRFEIGEYLSESVVIDGEEYQEVRLPSEPMVLDKGLPALPHVNRSVIIPDDARMDLKLLSSSFKEIPATIAPAKGNLLRTVDPSTVPYEFGEVYLEDAYFPGPLASLHEPYILRDHRGVVVQVNPFQYNPVTGTLRVYSEITVQLLAAGPGELNVFERQGISSRPSRAFREIYDAHFLNLPESSRYEEIDEEGNMLIICHDAWIPNMQPFVNHKNDLGISTTIIGVSTIGNNSTSIKNHIQSVYDSSDLAYLLLVGDIAEIASPSSSGGRSDPSYSKLAGSDHYPEIIVGRFSAQTPDHVDTQVQRTIEYETNVATEQPWFWKGTGIGSSEGAGIGDEGQSDIAHENEIRGWLLDAGYSEVDQIYDPGASAYAVATALNEGRGIVNYTGHGSTTSWASSGFSNSNINQLTNAGKLPFIVSVACVNGNFSSASVCFGESWLRATHNGEPTGAVATYMSSINQSWAPPMEGQDEFNLLLTDPTKPYHSFGALCFAGSSSMMDDYGSGGVSMFDTWHIFGDPSLRVVGAVDLEPAMLVSPEPKVILESHAGGPFGNGQIEFTITNTRFTPIRILVMNQTPWLTLDKIMALIPGGSQTTITATLDEAMRNWDNSDHHATLDFINRTNHSGDTTREIEVRIGTPVPRHEWMLDENPGWARDGLWQFGQPTGQGGELFGNPDPASGATGTQVFGVNLDGDYPPGPQEPSYLTSPPLDLSGVGRSSLAYQRWLNIEGPPTAEATVEVSVDGSQWELIWNNKDTVGDAAWTLASHDLGPIVGESDEAFLRWGYGVYDVDAMPCSGWNVDDIVLWGVPPSSRLTLTVDRQSLYWTALAGAVTYDVLVGDLDLLRNSDGDFAASVQSCAVPGVAGTSVDYGDEPAAGGAQWILVRGVASIGPMTFESLAETQTGLRDVEIAAGGGCP